MKHLRQILLVSMVTIMLPASAYANMGPAILWQFGFHLWFLTWVIGLGEGFFLFIIFRAWRLRSDTSRIFISMIAANVASAWLGSLWINNGFASIIVGDVTIENMMPAFWTMVYVTFALTVVIEFPFFLFALYGRTWLIPKAVAATFLAHGFSYALLFNWYIPDYVLESHTALEVVPASAFDFPEDYDLYYISADGKHVLRSELTGNNREVVATLDMDGIPDRLCACPRKVTEEIQEGPNKNNPQTTQRVCWESGFDLYVLMNINGEFETKLLLENFTQRAAVKKRNGEYQGRCDIETHIDYGVFKSFDDAEKWEFNSEWSSLGVKRLEYAPELHAASEAQGGAAQAPRLIHDVFYLAQTPFTPWLIRNGTHIAGDYGVFKLGEDQICILDPEKKRIALIARGFGPVVAKPFLEAPAEVAIEAQATR